MKIVVVGIGYVGLSLSVLLSQKYEVIAVDIVKEKVDKINNKVSPILDAEIEKYLTKSTLNLKATTNIDEALKDADFVIVSTPTNYDDEKNYFDTLSVEQVIKKVIDANDKAFIVIKSTVPVGFTEKISKKYETSNILFSPEFLREGKALYDNLYPSRIIVGLSNNGSDQIAMAKVFIHLLKECAIKKNISTLLMSSTEAEAVKLFANTYLALRISFFNELDTYASIHNLSTKSIVNGICLDDRIGDYYNNPSFGYGGYCLPKDTKQLLANYKGVPQNIITAIVESNDTRKDFIAKQIVERKPKIVGIYRLSMKRGSDNFRQSSIIDILKRIKDSGINVIVYEPSIKNKEFLGAEIVNNLNEFKQISDLVLANRFNEELNDIAEKVYTRDLFFRD